MPQDLILSKLIVGQPKTSTTGLQQLTVIGQLRDNIALAELYTWRDGAPFFLTLVRDLHMLQNVDPLSLHTSIAKWSRYTN